MKFWTEMGFINKASKREKWSRGWVMSYGSCQVLCPIFFLFKYFLKMNKWLLGCCKAKYHSLASLKNAPWSHIDIPCYLITCWWSQKRILFWSMSSTLGWQTASWGTRRNGKDRVRDCLLETVFPHRSSHLKICASLMNSFIQGPIDLTMTNSLPLLTKSQNDKKRRGESRWCVFHPWRHARQMNNNNESNSLASRSLLVLTTVAQQDLHHRLIAADCLRDANIET